MLQPHNGVDAMSSESTNEADRTASAVREKVLSTMRKSGLQLSEDGSSWVPLEEGENNTKRINLPNPEDQIGPLDVLAPLSIITAFFFLLAGFDTTGEEPFAACCLFLSIGCLAMLANSEGRVGVTILRIVGILIFFGIVFTIILDSMMSGGWGGMGVGGLSGWGGP